MNKILKIVIPITLVVIVIGGSFVIVNKNKTPKKATTTIEETNENKDKNDKTNEETNEDGTVSNDTTKIVKEKDLPKWTKCNVKIGENEFNLPISYKNFKKATGYEITDFPDDYTLESMQTVDFYAMKDGKTMKITIQNNNSDSYAISDCTVTTITVSNNTDLYEPPTDLVFPENIILGSSEEEVKEKIGDPFDTTGGVDSSYVSELWSINDIYNLSISFLDEKAVSITLSSKEQ